MKAILAFEKGKVMAQLPKRHGCDESIAMMLIEVKKVTKCYPTF